MKRKILTIRIALFIITLIFVHGLFVVTGSYADAVDGGYTNIVHIAPFLFAAIVSWIVSTMEIFEEKK